MLGAGFFFDKEQNTVFLQTGFSELESIWKKRDYDFKPHITLYDGQSRQYAKGLLNVLKRRRPFFKCQITELKVLRSNKGQSNFNFFMKPELSLLPRVVDQDMITNAEAISNDQRLDIVDSLCGSMLKMANLNIPREV